MSSDLPPAGSAMASIADDKAGQSRQQALRMMLAVAAVDIAIGAALTAVPLGHRGNWHVVAGLAVIVAGLVVAGWAWYFQRLSRRTHQ